MSALLAVRFEILGTRQCKNPCVELPLSNDRFYEWFANLLLAPWCGRVWLHEYEPLRIPTKGD